MSMTVQKFDALCLEMFKLKAKVDEEQAKVDELAKELDSKKKQIQSFMEESEKEKYFVSGHGTIYLEDRFTVQTPKSMDDKKAFFEYLEKRGIFLEMASVNSQTLNSFYKTEMETAIAEGESDFKLPGIGEPTHVRTLKTRKA